MFSAQNTPMSVYIQPYVPTDIHASALVCDMPCDVPEEMPFCPSEGAYPIIVPSDPADEPSLELVDDDVYALVHAALSYEFVTAARAFEWEGEFVLAALTKPFYLKSERDGARMLLEKELRQRLGCDNIIVLFDVDMFRRIDEDISDEDKQALLQVAKQRN